LSVVANTSDSHELDAALALRGRFARGAALAAATLDALPVAAVCTRAVDEDEVAALAGTGASHRPAPTTAMAAMTTVAQQVVQKELPANSVKRPSAN
jgi:hypothetical protein